MRFPTTTMVTVAVLALGACALDDGAAEDDLGEFADESDLRDDGLGKADGLGQYDYFTARRDTRKCMYPMCGGWWVDRVNRSKTRCVDGSYQDECYVAELSTDALGLSDDALGPLHEAFGAGAVVLRGAIGPLELEGWTGFGRFDASEAWVPGSASTAVGAFTRVTNSGIVCIQAPCPTMVEQKLNSALETLIAGLDFAPTGVDDAAIAKAHEAIDSADGLLVAGYRTTVTGPAGRAKARRVHQFYTRLVPAAAAAE